MRFVVPAGLERPTGGNRYDQALALALRAGGQPVDLVEVTGSWPVGDRPARGRLAAALSAGSGARVLVDGLLACGAPDAVAAAVAGGTRVVVLVHLPLGVEQGLPPALRAARVKLEGEALRAASGVAVASRWGASQLRELYALDTAVVAAPGASPAPPADGSRPPRLLHLATVSPVKDQLTTVAALRRLADLAWTAGLTGTLDADAGYALAVRRAAADPALSGRVELTGPLDGASLERAWQAADLLLLPSRVETWGMVVTEALARGIPAVVSAGTGSVEALGDGPHGLPGAVVRPGDADGLAAAVRRLLGEDRERARRAAAYRRDRLPGWEVTAGAVLSAFG